MVLLIKDRLRCLAQSPIGMLCVAILLYISFAFLYVPSTYHQSTDAFTATFNLSRTQDVALEMVATFSLLFMLPNCMLFEVFGVRVTVVINLVVAAVGWVGVWLTILLRQHLYQSTAVLFIFVAIAGHSRGYMRIIAMAYTLAQSNTKCLPLTMGVLMISWDVSAFVVKAIYPYCFIGGQENDAENQSLSTFAVYVILTTFWSNVLLAVALPIYIDPDKKNISDSFNGEMKRSDKPKKQTTISKIYKTIQKSHETTHILQNDVKKPLYVLNSLGSTLNEGTITSFTEIPINKITTPVNNDQEVITSVKNNEDTTNNRSGAEFSSRSDRPINNHGHVSDQSTHKSNNPYFRDIFTCQFILFILSTALPSGVCFFTCLNIKPLTAALFDVHLQAHFAVLYRVIMIASKIITAVFLITAGEVISIHVMALLTFTVFTLAAHILFIFFAHNITFYCLFLAIIAFSQSGISLIIPVLIHNYYGTTRFAVKFGLIWSLANVIMTILQLVFENEAMPCQGIECFTKTFTVAILFSVVGLISTVGSMIAIRKQQHVSFQPIT